MSSQNSVPKVALVTDSTSGLSATALQENGIAVVPLHVLLGDVDRREGVDILASEVDTALRKGVRVRTSRSTPGDMERAYRAAFDAGAEAVVSVHLSAQLSGTTDAAWLAARNVPGRVEVIDSASAGLGMGFAVLAGARVARDGGDIDAVMAAVQQRCAATQVLCYVHNLEFLRRGGRIGAAQSLLGAAFAVKPLIAIVQGRVEAVEKQRTSTRALARLAELSASAVRASGVPCDVAVHFVGHHARVDKVVEALTEQVGPSIRGGAPIVAEMPAVLAVHAGPGAVAVVVSPSGPRNANVDE